MEPLTIEQYKALIKEDQIKIGEDVEEEETYPPNRKTSILNEY